MQSVPLLLRHSIRSGLNVPRIACPIQTQLPHAGRGPLSGLRSTPRHFSICLQCQFRGRSTLLLSSESDKGKDEHAAPGRIDEVEPSAEPEKREASTATTTTVEEEYRTKIDSGNDSVQSHIQEAPLEEQKPRSTANGHGLPSFLESRRSHWSKQFSSMMDNLQSNIFVAGQRLNEVTGYASIEALKREIRSQEERLRKARAHVREAKDSYTAAINRRSTSQREVNELLQRKHAWSPADLERFTHLYRNDHANEVAESESQEALSAAEREAEDAAVSLSKSILSRYHEEQIWSDKIRRMSTWGTWGLMGVNVLLFLIFQIAVEPWRRRRLVKGFEEKVLEALEKDKTQAFEKQLTTTAAAVTNSSPDVPAVSVISEETEPIDPPSPIPIATESISAANEPPPTDVPVLQPEVSEPEGPIEPASIAAIIASAFTSSKSRLAHLFPLPPALIDSWRKTIHNLFSDHTLTITQREFTTTVIQSVAAGAAMMGLVIALIRPR